MSGVEDPDDTPAGRALRAGCEMVRMQGEIAVMMVRTDRHREEVAAFDPELAAALEAARERLGDAFQAAGGVIVYVQRRPRERTDHEGL